MTHSRSPVLQSLVDQLGRQRQLVEYLLFKLVEARLLLSSDDQAPFVPVAIGEIEGVLDRMRAEERSRERLIAGLAAEWGVSPDVITLGYLAEHAPQPYGEAFAAHRLEFMDLVDEVESVTRENRRLASAGLSRVQAAISGLVEDASTYSPDGRVERVSFRPMTRDEVL